jgi:hypothetical protein
VLALCDRQPAGATLDEVTTRLLGLAPLSPATARRAQAVLAWLHDLQLAALIGGRWRRGAGRGGVRIAPLVCHLPCPVRATTPAIPPQCSASDDAQHAQTRRMELARQNHIHQNPLKIRKKSDRFQKK